MLPKYLKCTSPVSSESDHVQWSNVLSLLLQLKANCCIFQWHCLFIKKLSELDMSCTRFQHRFQCVFFFNSIWFYSDLLVFQRVIFLPCFRNMQMVVISGWWPVLFLYHKYLGMGRWKLMAWHPILIMDLKLFFFSRAYKGYSCDIWTRSRRVGSVFEISFWTRSEWRRNLTLQSRDSVFQASGVILFTLLQM